MIAILRGQWLRILVVAVVGGVLLALLFSAVRQNYMEPATPPSEGVVGSEVPRGVKGNQGNRGERGPRGRVNEHVHEPAPVKPRARSQPDQSRGHSDRQSEPKRDEDPEPKRRSEPKPEPERERDAVKDAVDEVCDVLSRC